MKTRTHGIKITNEARLLRRMRSDRGLSMQVAGELCGKTASYISQIEHGRMMKAAEDGALSHVAVYSFSRFARSTTHLLRALETFQKLNVEFISLTEQIQTNSPMGRAFFTVIAAIAQLERELIVERVKNGLKAARARGKHIGREKKRDSELIRKLLKAGLTFRAVAAIAKCSHGSVWAEKKSMLMEQEAKIKLLAEEKKKTEELRARTIFNNLAGVDPITQARIVQEIEATSLPPGQGVTIGTTKEASSPAESELSSKESLVIEPEVLPMSA